MYFYCSVYYYDLFPTSDITLAVGGGDKYNIENCSLHLYYLCQGGHQLIKTIQPKFNESEP